MEFYQSKYAFTNHWNLKERISSDIFSMYLNPSCIHEMSIVRNVNLDAVIKWW